MAKRTELEDELIYQIKLANLPEPTREFMAVPGRRFRWDLAWPKFELLVEVHGATWVVGGHSTGTGIARDCQKLTQATLQGYYSMAFTKEQIRDGSALEALQQFFIQETA